ncbi:unannotated protein [freshwater metagenome]|uniref:Unannotated protein n=1 Tax=freshwater metagenome TaxID=449393 RepID=A0A6J7ML78_9ZZZZ
MRLHVGEGALDQQSRIEPRVYDLVDTAEPRGRLGHRGLHLGLGPEGAPDTDGSHRLGGDDHDLVTPRSQTRRELARQRVRTRDHHTSSHSPASFPQSRGQS